VRTGVSQAVIRNQPGTDLEDRIYNTEAMQTVQIIPGATLRHLRDTNENRIEGQVSCSACGTAFMAALQETLDETGKFPKLKRCGRCGNHDQAARYCSVKCQRSHWPVHKQVCRGRKLTPKPNG
jgi:hypothetical protein